MPSSHNPSAMDERWSCFLQVLHLQAGRSVRVPWPLAAEQYAAVARSRKESGKVQPLAQVDLIMYADGVRQPGSTPAQLNICEHDVMIVRGDAARAQGMHVSLLDQLGMSLCRCRVDRQLYSVNIGLMKRCTESTRLRAVQRHFHASERRHAPRLWKHVVLRLVSPC